jgi:hypothetical protein
MRVYLKSVLVWVIFILAESANGVFREVVLIEKFRFEGLAAHQISFVVGSLLILMISRQFMSWISSKSPLSKSILARIGILWICLTIAFEVSIGKLILHYSWERILSDYDITKGRLMSFGILLLFTAPFIATKEVNPLPKMD